MFRNKFCTVLLEPVYNGELTFVEAGFLDMVFHLQAVEGWCFATREYLANLLGISPTTLRRNITKLIESGYLERHKVTNYLRTTQKWAENYLERVNESEKQNFHPPVKLSDDPCQIERANLTYNNTIYKDNINNNNKNKKENITKEKRKVSDEILDESERFANWFKKFLPEKMQRDTTPSQLESWKAAYITLRTKYKYSKDTITRVCWWLRHDEFWESNFYSPAKLIRRRKECGNIYIHYYTEKMNAEKKRLSKAQETEFRWL